MAGDTTHSHHFTIIFFFFITFLFAQQLAASARRLEKEAILERHELWMARHGRFYKDSVEKDTRFKIFKDNVEHIDAFNARANTTYKLGVNEFADITNEEFRASYTGYQRPMKKVGPSPFRYATVSDVPPVMNWLQKGAVTPIKNQKECGCCWAFSAVAAIEGIHQLKTGDLISLSEQELVDCDVNGEDQGCSGGLMDTAFQFIIKNKGLTTESNYPYLGLDGTCNKKKAAYHAAAITGYEDVPENNEKALLKAVANQPVSVGIDGAGFEFQFYSTGVFTGECTTYLNHAVTVIGYGTSGDGTKYWLIKNSWGTGWGENGYMRIQRGVDDKEGLCGIATQASYPVM